MSSEQTILRARVGEHEMSSLNGTIACWVKYAGNSTVCEINGGTCGKLNETASRCSCPNGRMGIECADLVKPLTWVYGLTGTAFVLILIVSVAVAVRRYRATQGRDFEAAHHNAVKPRVATWPVWFIPVLRAALFIFVFAVHIEQLGRSEPQGWLYIFYTVQNFILLVTYMGLGAAMSAVAALSPTTYDTHPLMRLASATHYVILHIELPNTLLVDLVFWAILYPSCGGPCVALVNFTSVVQHASNVLICWVDYGSTSNIFSRWNLPFLVAYAGLYAVFHTIWTLARDSTVGHAPVYFFLSAANPAQPLWIVGVMLLHALLYFVVWAVSRYGLKRIDDDSLAARRTGFDPDGVDSGNPKFVEMGARNPPSPGKSPRVGV